MKTPSNEMAISSKRPISVIVALANMGENSIKENFEYLSEYKKKLANSKTATFEEVSTLRKMIRMMRMKSLVNGQIDLFKKLGSLDKDFEKIEKKLRG